MSRYLPPIESLHLSAKKLGADWGIEETENIRNSVKSRRIGTVNVQAGIPITAHGNTMSGRTGKWATALKEMSITTDEEPGDSFVVKNLNQYRGVTNAARRLGIKIITRQAHSDYKERHISKNVRRVWRIA